jgi:protein TonB
MLLFCAIVASVGLVLVGVVQIFRILLRRESQRLISLGKIPEGVRKKFTQVDLGQYSSLFGTIGLIMSLSLALMAFEWKSYEEVLVQAENFTVDASDEMLQVRITTQPPPVRPKVVQPEIIAVPDDDLIDDIDMDLDFTDQSNVSTPVDRPVLRIADEPVPEEKPDDIHLFVEETAEPIGGMEAFYKYVSKNLKYPLQAKRASIEGRVYLQFVIDKDGSISDVKIMKGIGFGCDEEAERVIKSSPKWKPGKQRGTPVRQRIVIPIHFKIG